MKKHFILILSFVSILTLYFFITYTVTNNENISVRDIYIENNKDDVSFYSQKYDIFNKQNVLINIDETYDSLESIISNTSVKPEYKIQYIININKEEQYFIFSYKLYDDNNIYLTSSVNISIFEYDNEYFFISDKGLITPCNEIFDISNINNCAAFSYTCFEETVGMDLIIGYIGAGCGAALGVSLSLVAGQAIYNSSVNNTTTNTNTIKEDIFLVKAANQVLANEENTYGWNKQKLKDALCLGMNMVVNGELVKVKEINKEKFTVYLGKYIFGSSNSYENVAKNDEGSVVFNMNSTDWDRLAGIYTPEGMWILNKFFLTYCMYKNCDFVLTTAPDKYCVNGVPLTNTSYSKELSYIYVNGYIWNVGAPAFTRVSR